MYTDEFQKTELVQQMQSFVLRALLLKNNNKIWARSLQIYYKHVDKWLKYFTRKNRKTTKKNPQI